MASSRTRAASPPSSGRPAARGAAGLPRITALTSALVRYAEPRKRLRGLDLVDAADAVEITVRTDAELPTTAVTPALFVGEHEIRHYVMIGPNEYKFILWDHRDVPRGAPIALGYPRSRPDQRLATAFRYEPTGSSIA